MVHRFVVAAILLGACSESSFHVDAGVDAGTDGRVGQCAAGLKPHGPACLPIFDECKDDEVSLLGGGCKKVGVEECTPAGGGVGIKGPPDWSCKPIGPPRTCLEGWIKTKTDDDFCEPILPKLRCTAGTREVIGKSECQPVGECGRGAWGNLKAHAKTVFVDASCAGECDGSLARPFRTIGEAVRAAAGGGQVAIAAGVYTEDVLLDKALSLVGRCAAMTRIVGKSAGDAAALRVTAAGVVIRGLGVSGPAAGVSVETNASATVEQVIVEKCSTGVALRPGAKAVLRDVLVDRAGGMTQGLRVASAEAIVERSTIRDLAEGASGSGEDTAIGAVAEGTASSVLVRDSIITGNRGRGILVRSSTVTVERCAVLDGEASVGWNGPGIEVDGRAAAASASIRDTLLAGNRGKAVLLHSGEATLERTVVRDSLPQLGGPFAGHGVGIVAYGYLSSGPSRLTLRESLVLRNVVGGVSLWGARGNVERSVIRENLSSMSGSGGGGIYLSPSDGLQAELTTSETLVAGNCQKGVSVNDSRAVLERTIIRDTRPQSDGNWGGAGLMAFPLEFSSTRRPSVVLRDCLIANNRSIGAYLDSDAIVERTVVRDTHPGTSADSGSGEGVYFLARDGCPGTVDPAPSFALRDSALSGNHKYSVAVLSATGTIERTAIHKTRLDDLYKAEGVGIVAGRLIYPDVCGGAAGASTLSIKDSLVEDSVTAGIAVSGSHATIERTRVRGTVASTSTVFPGWGDGVMVEGRLSGAAVLSLSDTLIESSARAGLMYSAGSGTVRRSIFRMAVFAIDLEEGATPEIGDDNVYESNTENRLLWGNNLTPSPPPRMPPPP